MDAVAVTPPPPVELIGKRLRKLYEQAGGDSYKDLSKGDIRKLPYAYFLPPEPPLPDLRPQLVRLYWEQFLPEAVSSGPRRVRRWIMPLFFTYCEAFDEHDPVFGQFAQQLELQVLRAEGTTAERLGEMARAHSFFRPSSAAGEVAKVLMSSGVSLDDAFRSMLLWQGFADTRMGHAVMAAALDAWRVNPDEPTVVRLLDWVSLLSAPVSKTPLAGRFAEALLTPWARRKPTDDMRSMLVEYFVRVYGDPRIEANRRYQWRDVSPAAVAVIMNWLAGDTLRGFIDVLEKTADDIWRYRQKFWMTYYDRGLIEEAWLALGWDALKLAKRLQANQKGLGYGRLEGGTQSDQSVLLLRIGNIVFTEWSHNGSLRAYEVDGGKTPKLYQDTYSGYALREPTSLDFHSGMNVNPELRHMNSAGGTWQRKARDFIRKHTGVDLRDYEILL